MPPEIFCHFSQTVWKFLVQILRAYYNRYQPDTVKGLRTLFPQ